MKLRLCAGNWDVVRLFLALGGPTLVQAQETSSWTTSSVLGWSAPWASVPTQAGRSTTVATTRMPESSAQVPLPSQVGTTSATVSQDYLLRSRVRQPQDRILKHVTQIFAIRLLTWLNTQGFKNHQKCVCFSDAHRGCAQELIESSLKEAA